MKSDSVYLAGFMAFTFVLITVVLIAVDWAGANGRLRRNQWAGIRTPSTMRSDLAWAAGHRAALRLTPLHLFTLVVLLIALWATVRRSPTMGVVNIVGVGGALVFVLVALFTALIAGRAAKAADDHRE